VSLPHALGIQGATGAGALPSGTPLPGLASNRDEVGDNLESGWSISASVMPTQRRCPVRRGVMDEGVIQHLVGGRQ